MPTNTKRVVPNPPWPLYMPQVTSDIGPCHLGECATVRGDYKLTSQDVWDRRADPKQLIMAVANNTVESLGAASVSPGTRANRSGCCPSAFEITDFIHQMRCVHASPESVNVAIPLHENTATSEAVSSSTHSPRFNSLVLDTKNPGLSTDLYS